MPEAHAGVASVLALMIEINRRLYMDERTGVRSKGFAATAAGTQRVLRALAEAVGG